MRTKQLLGALIVLLPLLIGSFISQPQTLNPASWQEPSRVVNLENGDSIELAPDEVLYQYDISAGPTQRSGTGDVLLGSEYGVRTDSFSDRTMYYDSGTGTTETANLSIPLGEGWEGYEVSASLTSITENRTWIENSDFSTDTIWDYDTYDAPSTWGPYSNTLTSSWSSSGGYPGGCASFGQNGYWYDDRPTTSLYGYWYDVGDKSYAVQNLTIDRGDVTSLAISLDYWADCAGWGSYMTGFFELFVSVGDPDNGGTYLWNIQFDAVTDDNIWYSSGLVEINPSAVSLPDINLWIGLRTTQLEWYRSNDILPRGRMDNIQLYVTAKATPEDVNLQMNGVDVSNVLDQGVPVFGLGTVSYTAATPWTDGAAFANFSWTPSPYPPDPDFDINVDIDVDVSVFARRYNVETVYDTETFDTGEQYYVANNSVVNWDTNFYVAVPGGYASSYFFNVTIPSNRDIRFVAQPSQRTVNLTSGWTLGDPGDGVVNISVYDITTTVQNGFWYLKGQSPNMITYLEVWDGGTSQWVRTKTFRANENTRFRATLPATYTGDVVNFTVYNSASAIWTTLQAAVDGSGYAVTSFVNLDAFNSSVGAWEVQAHVNDAVSGGSVHNIGFFNRAFSIDHSTDISVKYPVGSATSWTKNVTHGNLVLLQFRVNDSDNGNLLSGGTMTYSWAAGSGVVSDLGTGEYSVTLDTGDLPSNGQYLVSLQWSKSYYDSISRSFTINAIYTTELLSSDAPGVDVPSGYDAVLEVQFKDQADQPISGADITCNWSLDTYTVTPVGGSPGYYSLSLETDAVPLDTYAVEITARKDFYETRSIILSVQVRELFTSAIPSTSQLSLPVGYTTSFTITYTDTDHNLPISGAENLIRCNWSDIHSFGDQNYTVAETSPGVYQVTIYSEDLDVLKSYRVDFFVESFGAQNHTFAVTVVLRTHLTSFFLVNPINPTPYTGDVLIYVSYYDVDADIGIENGTAVGYNVLMVVESSIALDYEVTNGSIAGQYIISIPANQWGFIGPQALTLYANWTGPTVKYYNRIIYTSVTITGTPTDIFLGESPVMTPYGEDVSFTIIYYDAGNATGVVNSTGLYPGNVHVYVEVLTTGQTLTQSLMTISEVDPVTRPGEYRIEFSTSYLSGLIGCDLRFWFNWTKGAMPLYKNQTILLTIYSTYRQSVVDWNPLPLTPYDELVNLTFIYRDVISGNPILNAGNLSIATPGYGFSLYYLGDATGEFAIEVDTSLFAAPGAWSFQIQITWSGSPYYQNRTINIPVTVRERYTDLTHGSYAPIQYGETLHLVFTYRDLDDFTSIGMDGGELTLIGLSGYTVDDNLDGTYTLHLDTSVFPTTGTFTIYVNMEYGGTRFCADATDFFYLSIVQRRTQLTSDLPDLAPFLTQANITIQYTDDITAAGIAGADVYASCATADQTLVLDSNYWVDDLGGGNYRIRISTVALGTFGSYTIQITVNWTGTPFYRERTRNVVVEVSRRPASVTVSKSPLNTPFLSNVEFEITVMDLLNGSLISVDKSVLILTHNMGTLILDSEYTLSGSSGIYVIAINSTTLTSVLVSDYAISIKLFWGDAVPYYANSTTSTQVSITERFTQGSVLSTPAAYYYFNLTAIVRYSDYLTGDGIPGASLSITCLNDTTFARWIIDNGDGTYRILVDTNDLAGIGRYLFSVDITWSGTPYYDDVLGVDFAIFINPVSTSLKFDLPQGVTYYLGDTVVGNITFADISEGVGIDGALVTSDWFSLYGTTHTITPLGNGIYEMSIDTSGLDAQIYIFSINASKYLHLNRSVTADIVLAAIPVQIQLVFTPTSPTWGEDVEFSANVTDARTGAPVIGALVNLSISIIVENMTETAVPGIYNLTISTTSLISGEFTVRVQCTLLNYESRQRDFQIRIDKVASKISADLDPQVAVNGQTVAITAYYLVFLTDVPIETGMVSYSWIGGTGYLVWSASEMAYVGQMVVSGVPVGNHQILIQGSSSIHKTVSTPITVEIALITTALSPYQGVSVLQVVSGDFVNVTVYLENIDLGGPVLGAVVEYGAPSNVSGILIGHGNGYYSALVPTDALEIGDWILSVSSSAAGFTPSYLAFTLSIIKIPTEVAIIGSAILEGYYGENVTFTVAFRDTHNDIGVSGASATYALEQFSGTLVDNGDGTYEFTVNTTWVAAGRLAHDIYITFQMDRYDFAFGVVQLRSLPILTQISGLAEITVPVGDDFSQLFTYLDTMNSEYITDASVYAIWEFGTQSLTSLNNGSYRFGFLEANRTRLEIRTQPYLIRIQFSKGNYSSQVFEFLLTVRPIDTEVIYEIPSTTYVGEVFYVRITFWDLDHDFPIAGALNTTSGLSNIYNLAADYGNGTYLFAFQPGLVQLYRLVITLEKADYATGVFERDIYSVFTPEVQAFINWFSYLGLILIFVSVLAASYIRVWSVPKLLRILRRMVSRLAKGVIPPPANVRDRRAIILEEMNADLAPVKIRKSTQDIAESTVEVVELDVENLLDELAVVVGLGEDDIAVLRTDLEKMRPSERAGFIGEVLRQERSRRARELAEAEAAEAERPIEEAERKLTEEELEHLREELIKMGIEPSEADLMVEQAKSLTKAEIDALLDQIGGLK